MKKKLKLYAVAGMMEYQTIVKVGKNSVKVTFTGGSISNGCTQPARFSTKNLIIQNAIEASDEFARGRIRLEKEIPLNEEIKVEKPSRSGGRRAESLETTPEGAPRAPHRTENTDGASPEDRPAGAEQTGAEPVGRRTEESPQAGFAEDKPNEAKQTPTEPEAPTHIQTETAETATDEAETESMTEVEVSCKDVAKQYLQDHYGERPAPLRTWVDVQACGAKYGITFKSPTLE